VKLRFLGTRGEIEARTARHRRHSSLLVAYRGRELIVDWGLDWQGELRRFRPAAIVLTHAHPDHAAGLRDGAACPVYATDVAWAALGHYPIERRGVVAPRRPFRVGSIRLEAFAVQHSLRAPAVGYRIEAGRAAIFYAPDLVAIAGEQEALTGLDAYVGDGAAVTRSIIRRRDGRAIGHASIRAQLEWCAANQVPRAVFTHCGSEIVKGDPAAVADRVDALGRERSVRTEIAYDGLELVLR
jgi:phosphoribosyl 1,2-cyclic phosphodiesterase